MEALKILRKPAEIDWDYDEVTFDAEEGKTYYVVVDGIIETVKEYDLVFACGGE